ncbi:hypothetical protein C3Y87_06285 [Carbonactinospora thermoautotrophica]|uniref:penicillin-binding transpeptidase domain-containing protein n=1 Tax=Carbonactinospora thermoautotrophica TaxID=1469144 RepID=UPI00226D9F60|nr:penicillin-binding transpeptidase domain-containing protein [Carbonactinospora thermoautotrophica]MCX9191022.1 hypothetical protein [Carbonactinospora thermoautotrophica]
MKPRSARVAVVLSLLVSGAVACSLGEDRDRATEAARAFLDAWQSGDNAKAAGLTDNPAAAKSALDEVEKALSVTKLKLDPKPGQGDGEVIVPFHVRMTLRGLGDWAYDSAVPVEKKDGERWLVRWSPAVVHPKLTDQTRLRRIRELPERAPILDRHGKPLLTEQPVVTVGVWPAKLVDPGAAYAALQRAFQIDPAKLQARVRQAKPDEFVEVITVRQAAYQQAAATVGDLPGIVTREDTRPLAETPSFARAVLGTVGPATKETLANAGESAMPGDSVGTSGLSYAYQRQLAGSPGGEIELVRRDTKEPVETLWEFTAKPGEPLKTTLDHAVQAAAEQALAGVDKPASLVAVKPSTGEILAVANGPGPVAFNRAFVGKYPPGSTFKVVTTAALLQSGLRTEDPVECPKTTNVHGKTFYNENDSALPPVPFRTDFAKSCNNAFISQRDKLKDDTLTEQAKAFGIGGEWNVGLPSFDGSVPPAKSEAEKAADMIGQGKVEASPLVMAAVAATVQAGEFRQPIIVPNTERRYQAPTKLSPEVVNQLRALMRAVVTEGSGAQLRDLPGEPAAKTGTAQYGDENPPRTHAWVIGYRGDLAFALLIEDGGSGGRDAAPVVARFLRALD